MRRSWRIAAAVMGIALAPGVVAAQSSAQLPDAYVAVKGSLGFLGSLDVHTDAHTFKGGDDDPPIEIVAVDDSSDLMTPGAGADVSYLFSADRYLAIGPVLGIHSWQSKAGDAAREGGSLAFDLGVTIQPRLPVSEIVELYVALPITFTMSFLNEYKLWVNPKHLTATNEPQGDAEDVDPTYGYGIGAFLGARFAVSGHFGVLSEIGYQRYGFSHGVDFQVSDALNMMGIGTTLGLDCVVHQFRFNVGVFF